MMKVIVITAPDFLPDEAESVRILLSEGADRVHLRKPGSCEADFRRLIESIPEEFYPSLTLQDHVGLAVEYGIGGVHLNSRNLSVPDGFHGLVSRSCHSLEEVVTHKTEDYLFLSPIYDSISKTGYHSAFSPESLESAVGVIGPRIMALGGVRPENLPELREYGFGGAAFLGYIWKDATPKEAAERIRKIREILLEDK